MEKFEHDTYIVLDIPEPVSNEVMALRMRYEKQRTVTPVEITIIGSSGVGTLKNDQNPSFVFEILEQITYNISPIKSAFSRITHFPNTKMCYLEPRDSEPFSLLQKKIIDTNLRFNNNPHPYTPHCSIARFKDGAEKAMEELLNSPFPKEEFILDCMSVYSLNEWDCRLLYRTKLKGGT